MFTVAFVRACVKGFVVLALRDAFTHVEVVIYTFELSSTLCQCRIHLGNVKHSFEVQRFTLVEFSSFRTAWVR